MSGQRQGRASSSLPDFDQVFADLRDEVYRVIRTMIRDPVEAQDLTQETFVRVYNALSTYRGEASLRTWVHRIAKNVVRDGYRRSAVRPDHTAVPLVAPDGGELTAPSSSPAGMAEQRLSRECIRAKIDSLPDIYREVIVLHDLQGLKNSEVARRLGISLEAAKMRVHRGRTELRKLCERDCRAYQDERNETACQPKGGASDR